MNFVQIRCSLRSYEGHYHLIQTKPSIMGVELLHAGSVSEAFVA